MQNRDTEETGDFSRALRNGVKRAAAPHPDELCRSLSAWFQKQARVQERGREKDRRSETDRQIAAAMLSFLIDYSNGLLGIVLFLVPFHTLFIYFSIFLHPS